MEIKMYQAGYYLYLKFRTSYSGSFGVDLVFKNKPTLEEIFLEVEKCGEREIKYWKEEWQDKDEYVFKFQLFESYSEDPNSSLSKYDVRDYTFYHKLIDEKEYSFKELISKLPHYRIRYIVTK